MIICPLPICIFYTHYSHNWKSFRGCIPLSSQRERKSCLLGMIITIRKIVCSRGDQIVFFLQIFAWLNLLHPHLFCFAIINVWKAAESFTQARNLRLAQSFWFTLTVSICSFLSRRMLMSEMSGGKLVLKCKILDFNKARIKTRSCITFFRLYTFTWSTCYNSIY